MIPSSTSQQRSPIVLPNRLETVLEKIYSKHKCPPINDESRQRLSSIPEELAFDLLRTAFNSPPEMSSLDRFIASKLAVTVTSSQELSADSLRIQSYDESLHISPQLLALSELEFKKAFLLLSYIPGKDLGEVEITAEEIRGWKDLSMVAYEAAVWESLGKDYCSPTDRRMSLGWEDSAKGNLYQCHVASDGSYTFKGPLLQPTGTHLHKVLGDDNVLTVTFEDLQKHFLTCSNDPYSAYKRIAKNGIMVGLRRYQFFVFKDGGKGEKKINFYTKGVKCYFIRTDSTSANDMGTPYIFSGKSIYEARMHFMHVHTLPSLADYTVLEKVYSKHKCPPINDESRQRLSSIPEESAFDLLRKAFNSPVMNNLDRFIASKLAFTSSPAKSTPPSSSRSRVSQEEICVDPEAPSLTRQVNGGSSPQLLALSELEFKKAFLLLSYIPGKDVGQVKITAEEIRGWKDLSMVAYEAAVWDSLGNKFCSPTDRRLPLECDSAKTRYYQCHVASDGSYTFKGPLLEPTGTHLHKVLGDDNVLTVKFADVPKNFSTDRYNTYRRIAKNGIMLGLRRYQFFVFKDGGKEEKKKDFSTKGVKCYFIRTDSTSANDMGTPYIFSGMSIYEARMHFMHVHTLPSLANYMARFSLILSKTKKLEVDLTGINFEKIDDIHCHDQNNNDVLDKNGKPCIHSDGTGYISEDLARMCPVNVFKGKCLRSDNVQTPVQEPPLLIQFRMFYDGYAVKGTFLLNKKLPPRTVQVRPSMIKVSKDPALSNFSTFDSLEVVTTSNPPKRTKLSRNLVALLSYGGIPDEFFLDTLLNTLEETKTIFNNKRAALKAALHYGDMDDQNAAQMILVGIPLDEPHLQDQLFTFSKTERKDLKAGKLPVSESYYLMGTVDPTGLLKEDEVCVILESGQISGDVLVYRNPGLHFGDIHVLKATYVKALEEYVGNSKYGVFFPQKGPRSLGDEIAGGDFDGDLYFISRNPELLEHFKPSEPWVSLTPPTKGNSARKPSHLSPQELEEELFDMFLKARFHASNVVGIAADSWLTIMDRFLILGDENAEEKAEMKKKMLKLTDIYYDALDAPKKGAKVYLSDELKPDIFPHYMERDQKFKSTSILGMIYDFVKSQTADEHRPSSEISKLSCFKDEPVSDFYKEKWGQLYKNYLKEMSQALRDKDESASEVIQRHKQEKDESASEVIQRYKQELYGAAGFEDSKKTLEELYPQALALYNIAYDHAIEKKKIGGCGFAWKVAGPVLCRFYLEKTQVKSFVSSPAVVKELWG